MRELNYFEAENESLKARIINYQHNESINKNTIQDLRQRVSDFNNLQSDLNNKITELQIIKNSNEELKKQIIFVTNNEVDLQKELSQSDRIKHKLEEVETGNTNLQIQLQQATNELIKLNSTVRYLKEQASRMTLLECLLTDVQQERDKFQAIVEKIS